MLKSSHHFRQSTCQPSSLPTTQPNRQPFANTDSLCRTECCTKLDSNRDSFVVRSVTPTETPSVVRSVMPTDTPFRSPLLSFGVTTMDNRINDPVIRSVFETLSAMPSVIPSTTPSQVRFATPSEFQQSFLLRFLPKSSVGCSLAFVE